MSATRIGILHPGAMGISIAAAAQNAGNQVMWASAGRSEATRKRASEHGLLDAGTVARLCAEVDIVASVCPPHAAEDIANQVLAAGFGGTFLDANAIAPQRAQRIGQAMEQAGIAFVDGGIIGGPAWKPGTVLYLAGRQAGEVAACFSAGPLETRVLGPAVGRASALKMCYAAYSKGTTALLCAVLAAAERSGVRDELFAQWAGEEAGKDRREAQRVRGVTAKAWRFAGEMDEIAATFRAAGRVPRRRRDAVPPPGRLQRYARNPGAGRCAGRAR